MDIDYTVTAIDKPSRQVRVTIHFQNGDKLASYVVPEDVTTLAGARDYVEGRIIVAAQDWQRNLPWAPANFGAVLDGVIGQRRTINNAL